MQPEPIEPPLARDGVWLPYAIRREGARWCVDWCDVTGSRFEEPYFDPSIARILQNDPRSRRSTSIETLSQIPARNVPAGFIFHASRCGSTLITQMLASLRRMPVIAEPGIVEALLRGAYPHDVLPIERRALLLRNVLDAFAIDGENNPGMLIKFTARAIVDAALIRRVYPDAPCAFVYREPIEILVSLAGNQTDRLPPGLSAAGLLDADPQAISAMRPIEFWAQVVAKQFAAAVEMCNASRSLLVNYAELPEAAWTNIAGFFGIDVSAADVRRMQEIAERNVKDPSRSFRSDRAEKQAAATPELRALADRFVRPHYERLEFLRAANATRDMPAR